MKSYKILYLLMMYIASINSNGADVFINGKLVNLKFKNYELGNDGRYKLYLLDDEGNTQVPTSPITPTTPTVPGNYNNDKYVYQKVAHDLRGSQELVQVEKNKITITKFKMGDYDYSQFAFATQSTFGQVAKRAWISESPTRYENANRNCTTTYKEANGIRVKSKSAPEKRGYYNKSTCQLVQGKEYYMHFDQDPKDREMRTHGAYVIWYR